MADMASLIQQDLKEKIQALEHENQRLWRELAGARRLGSQHRKAFELSGAPAMIIDGDMTLIMVNREFVKLTGFTRKEIEGRMKWTAFIDQEDVDRMKGYHVGRRDARPGIPSEDECRR